MISNILGAYNFASDWPRTFFTPQMFLFSISLRFVNKYQYFMKAYAIYANASLISKNKPYIAHLKAYANHLKGVQVMANIYQPVV